MYDFVNRALQTGNWMLGLDLGERACGDETTPANTAYLFFALANGSTTTLSADFDLRLEGGRDHMISISKEALCLYSTKRTHSGVSATDSKLEKLTSCFPSDALVELAPNVDGVVLKRRMDVLQVGDTIQTGPNTWAVVTMFTHRDPNATSDYVRLFTSAGADIELSLGQYIRLPSGALRAAAKVTIGDNLILADGNLTTVIRRELFHSRRGLYNPQTMDGSIVVNGIVASTFTTAIQPFVGRVLLTVPNFLHRGHPGVARVFSELFSYFADFQSVRIAFSSLLPSGAFE